MGNALSTLDFIGKKFFVDNRLNQIRNVENPHEFYDLNHFIIFALKAHQGYLLTGKNALILMQELLNSPVDEQGCYGTPEQQKAGVFYDVETRLYVAFDNTEGLFCVEKFEIIDEAILWAAGEA